MPLRKDDITGISRPGKIRERHLSTRELWHQTGESRTHPQDNERRFVLRNRRLFFWSRHLVEISQDSSGKNAKIANSAASDTHRLSQRGSHLNSSLRYALVTVVAAILTLSMKLYAAWLTSSVGLLSDAMESIVNLVTSFMLVILLRIAKAPPDHDHPHGHDKAEYFANGVQGTLIMLAGIGITVAAAARFFAPRPLESGTVGLVVSILAALVNVVVARLLYRAAKELKSSALEGEAAHLMSDVWTSIAVVLGVGLVYLTGWPWLDPTVALAMSGFIFITGWHLLKRSVAGLMDSSLPVASREAIRAVLQGYRESHHIEFHALRTRMSGARTFVSVHLLVPGEWTVQRGHDLADEIEARISKALDGASVLTHLEPIEDDTSFQDIDL